MVTVFYESMFLMSLVFLVLYVLMWHKHFDVHLTLIFLLIPITNLGYCFFILSESLGEALLGNKMIYLGGTFLPLLVTLSVFGLCKIKPNIIFRVLMILTALMSYGWTLTAGYNGWFYKSVTLDMSKGYPVLVKEYGPMHTVFLCLIVLYTLVGVIVLIRAFRSRKDVSNKIIFLLFLPEVLSVLSYFGGKVFGGGFEIMPLSYNLALLVFLLISYRISMYDVTDSAIDSIVEKGNTGFASFDFRYRFLGMNEPAGEMIPWLKDLSVDSVITDETVIKWLNAFELDESNDKFRYRQDGNVNLIDINYLMSGKRKVGYQLLITDDTKNQKYLEMLEHFNSKLEQEVKSKTEHIVEMHDNLILSMATMVESRDNSTGGHIKRTSDGVRIIVSEMVNGGYKGLSEKFVNDIIKAAPMHDLGKIAVDDAVLRFEGRYNDEQYAKMKKHAAEGARIVHEILKETDDYDFHILAENVAHYHHERWDGSGYPEGLKGEQIPLEARIMAIADVYDALVSKRCYKESMPFADADKIIMDGFGTQFDGSLKPYYVAARPKLEEYYSNIEDK